MLPTDRKHTQTPHILNVKIKQSNAGNLKDPKRPSPELREMAAKRPLNRDGETEELWGREGSNAREIILLRVVYTKEFDALQDIFGFSRQLGKKRFVANGSERVRSEVETVCVWREMYVCMYGSTDKRVTLEPSE